MHADAAEPCGSIEVKQTDVRDASIELIEVTNGDSLKKKRQEPTVGCLLFLWFTGDVGLTCGPQMLLVRKMHMTLLGVHAARMLAVACQYGISVYNFSRKSTVILPVVSQLQVAYRVN